MNPARSLGPAIVSGVYKNQWIFVIAPILGAMTATGIYSLLRQPKQEMLMSKALQSIWSIRCMHYAYKWDIMQHLKVLVKSHECQNVICPALGERRKIASLSVYSLLKTYCVNYLKISVYFWCLWKELYPSNPKSEFTSIWEHLA